MNIEINGKETPLTMKLGYEGIAYFNNSVSEVDGLEEGRLFLILRNKAIINIVADPFHAFLEIWRF